MSEFFDSDARLVPFESRYPEKVISLIVEELLYREACVVALRSAGCLSELVESGSQCWTQSDG